jgi:Flp pilus assembly protein TadG
MMRDSFPLPLLKLARLCRSFLASKNGNVAVIFGIAAVPLFGALGAALDFSRVTKSQSTLQSAMDASVLAGLSATSGNEIATATRIFNANFNDPDTALGAPSYTLDTACGCLTGAVAGTIRMTIMSVVGISTMPVGVSSKAANKKTVTKPLTATLAVTLAQGWYPKIAYIWTKDSSGTVTAITQLVSYNFRFTPSQYGWTTPNLNVASQTLTLDPNYQTWGYKIRVYYGTALGDQSMAGFQGPYYDMWSDNLPFPVVSYQGATLQGGLKSTGNCDDTGGKTIHIEDGGNSDYNDMVLTMKCTTGQATVAGTPYLAN